MGCGASHFDTNDEEPRPEDGAFKQSQHQVPFEVQQAEETLLQAWGGAWTTTGYTDGHHCIQETDTTKAEQAGASLLYGEVLPAGMSKLLDSSHLHVQKAESLVDLGSGCGRIATLAFLAYPSLSHVSKVSHSFDSTAPVYSKVYAVELSPSRHALAAEAAKRLAEVFPAEFQLQVCTTSRVRIAHRPQAKQKLPSGSQRRPSGSTAQLAGSTSKLRILDICCGDMWRIPSAVLQRADIVLMHTEFTAVSSAPFKQTVALMKPTARFVTYNDPTVWYSEAADPPPFQQLEANVPESDTFLTSWSTSRGHHLFTWRRVPLLHDKTPPPQANAGHVQEGDSRGGMEESKHPGH